MAPKKKSARTVDVWKRKKWYKVLAPGLFNQESLGETPALDHDLVMGRTIKSSLMNLTRDIKKQHIDVTFEIAKIQGESAYTYIKKYQISPAYIKRCVRRNRNRIDDSFVGTTKDGWNVRIKPFILTRFATNKSINTAVRKKTKNYLLKALSENTMEVFVKDIVVNKLQRHLKDLLKNIYGIRTCEIRSLEVIGKNEGASDAIPDKVEKASEEKADKKVETKEEKKEDTKEKAAEKKKDTEEKSEAKDNKAADKKEAKPEDSKESEEKKE